MMVPMEQAGVVTLDSQHLEFSNEVGLPQFNVINYQIRSEKNGSVSSIEIKLKRIFSYQIVNTYMPTSTLLILAQTTLYFEESQLELGVGLLLTVLLVMYTLYQSICASLTPTAYLKMIDYWLFFCLLMPFLSFMIEMYWLLQKTQSKPNDNGKGWVKPENEDAIVTKKQKRCFRYCAQAITLGFFISYFIVAVLMFNQFIE